MAVDWWGVVKVGAIVAVIVIGFPFLLRGGNLLGGGRRYRRGRGGRIRYGPNPAWWVVGWLARRFDSILLALVSVAVLGLIVVNARA